VARVLGFVVGALVLLGAVSPAGAEKPLPAPKAKELRIGLLKPMFKDVSQVLIDAAAKPFKGMIQKKTGLQGSLTMHPDYKELAAAIKEGKIDVAVFHGFEYAWVKDTPGLAPLVVAVPNCGSVQACLVVNENSKAKTPGCLKGQRVLVPKGTKAHCSMFLDHVRNPLPEDRCRPTLRGDLSIEEALGEIAKPGGADAALVDISSLKSLEQNFPGCFRALKVLDQSVELPPAIVVYREGALEPKTVKELKDGLMNCSKSAEGYAFTVFWQLKGFAEVSPEYNALVKKCLATYPAPGEAMAPMPHLPAPR
jgi:ABC-type phosphate/phosphonate transport system substrate-binding protein